MKRGVLVVFGHTGSGKSQLTRRFLEEVPRSVCVDTMAEYGGVIIEDPQSLAVYLDDNKHNPRFRVSYRDNGTTQVPMPLVFKMLQNLRDTWVCLEEASKWGNANSLIPEVRWFIQYGRHHGISVLLVARRPQEIDRMATAMADTIVSFVQREPRDLDYIRQMGGEAAEARIRSLGLYEWDYVVDQHAEIRRVLTTISGGKANVSDASGLDSRNVVNGADRTDRRSTVAPAEIEQGNEGTRDRTEGGRPAGVVPEPGVEPVNGET